MMSSDVIYKDKVIVPDDFFNEIVNGLKQPIEENIEKENSKDSKIKLGGKQLSLFKNKVVPIISKEIEKNGLVECYVSELQKSYYTTRINEVQQAFQDSVGDYKQIEYEVEDELEEVESDNKNRALFLYKGFQLLNTFRKLYNIYSVIQAMRKNIKFNDDSNKWDSTQYDLNTKSGIHQAGENLVGYLNEELLRYVPAFTPILQKTTESVYVFSQKAFKKINNEFYWMVVKEVALWAAIEAVSWLAGVFTFGAGYGAGKVAQAARVASFMNKVRKIAMIGKGLSALNKTIKGTRVVRRLGVSAYKAGRKFRAIGGKNMTREIDNAIGHVLRHRREYWRSYKIARGAYVVYDLFDVDNEDINEVHKWAQEKFRPYVSETMRDYQRLRKDYETIKNVNDVFKKLNEKVKSNIVESFIHPSQPDKYESKIEIKNLNFDFNTIKKLGDFLSNAWYYYRFEDFDGVLKRESETKWRIGKHLFDADFNSIMWEDQTFDRNTKYSMMSRDGIVKSKHDEDTIISLSAGSGRTARVKKIKLNDDKGKDGIEVIVGQFGEIIGLKFHYLFHAKTKWMNYNQYNEYIRYGKEKTYLGDRPINSKQLELKTQIHYFDNDGEIDGDKKIFSVDNKGDFINIQKLMQQTPEKYNLQKIDWWSSNQIAKPSIVESKDLSEIIVFRNSLVEQEVKFGKLVDNLLTEFNNQMAKSRNTVSVEESQSDSASQTQPTKQHNNWMDVLINSVSTAPVVTY